jgi:divalent metal cation (Fe/Co/Zn/Cd) transporter
VVTTTRTLSFAQSHELTERIEKAINLVEPRAEVLVHIEPIASGSETSAEAVRAVALRLGIATHHEQVYDVGGQLEAVLHIEVDPNLTLFQAHEIAEGLSDTLVSEVPGLRRVATHIEAAEPHAIDRREVSAERSGLISAITEFVLRNPCIHRVDEVRLYSSAGSDLDTVICCSFDGGLLVGAIHTHTEKLEHELRDTFPELGRLIIHAEPA